ncbi:MAG TPA: PmoA family protein [Phycisphaerae bacterium]
MMRITIHAPEGGRPAAPVAIPLPLERLDRGRMIGLLNLDTSEAKPVQVDSRGDVCWWEDALADDEVRTYRLSGAGASADCQRVVVREFADSAEIRQRDEPIATYRFGSELSRPYLDALATPRGLVVTSAGPEGPVAEHLVEGNHRSCWVGWADVDGVDHWSDARAHGVQRHRRFGLCVSGPVFGRLGALIDWLDADGRLQFTEQRVFHFYSAPGPVRIIDVAVRFGAPLTPLLARGEGAIGGSTRFGDTPDGGMCAVRVARPLSVIGGGSVRNAHGETGQEGCWGSPANWCDYSGSVDGVPAGIALFDCPFNVRHPTHWLITESGIMAANPFGLAEFVHANDVQGGYVWHHNDVLMFRYRILVYDGRLTADQIEAHYRASAKPVHVDIE